MHKFLRIKSISEMDMYLNRIILSKLNTLNHSEVEKFSRIKKEWWNENSKNGTGPLHAMNPTRIEFIRSERAKVIGTQSEIGVNQIRNQRILDVGCGGGLLSESLARLGASVHSIDPSENNIIIASEHSQLDEYTRTIQYQQATIEHIVASGAKYDIVCALEVIEHVNNPEQFLEHCCACLADGGSLFISTMNRTMKSYMFAILGAEAVLQLLPLGTHDWYKFMTPKEIQYIIEQHTRSPSYTKSTTTTIDNIDNDNHSNNNNNNDYKMVVKSVKGLVPELLPSKLLLHPFLSKWKLSENDTDVNYMLHAVLEKGK